MSGKIDFLSMGGVTLYPVTLVDAIYALDGSTLKSKLDNLQTQINGKQPSGSYALASHNHDSVYSKTSHNHDSAYAKASHTHSYLPLSGGLMNGPIRVRSLNDNIYIINDACQYKNWGSAVNGIIKITLPYSWTDTMQYYEIDIFNYKENTSAKLIIASYNHAGSSTSSNGWYNPTVFCTNISLVNSIRLAHDGSNCCILLGNTSSVWSCIIVNISKGMYSYKNYSNIVNGFKIDVITSESGLINIVKPDINSGLNADTLDGKHATDFPLVDYKNGYYGIFPGTSYLRTPNLGLIPYESGGGSSLIGTASWPFKGVYSKSYYENGINGHITALQSGAPNSSMVWAW